jgi:antitoxin component YwqK of YwqJK toxin-antitoxin module
MGKNGSSSKEFVQMEANDDVYCYLCYEGETEEKKYALEPCACKGSIRIHMECVERLWSNVRVCGICKTKWKKPRGIVVPRPKEYRDGLELVTTVHKDCIKQVYTVDAEGKKHGQWTQTNRFGDMMAQCNYVHGLRQGLFQTWGYRRDENGDQILTMQCNYVDDKRHGLYEVYDPYKGFGHVLERVHYMEGKMDGVYEKYESVGVLEKKCHYYKGKLHGIYEEYALNGKLVKKCGYLHGKLHGPYYDEEYDYKERPAIYRITECHYHCGKLEGPYKIYNQLSDKTIVPYEESFYVGGKFEGVVKEYNRVDGSLEFVVHNKHGKLHGSFSRFQNGVLVEHQMWNHGKQHGEFMKWDAEGNLTKREVYRNGGMITV